MKTLIVLCAGGRKIDNKPLYLCKHPSGKIVFNVVIEGIFPEKYDRIIYSILKDDVVRFKADKVIVENCLQQKAEVFVLEKKTDGPAETLSETIRGMKVEGEVAIRDSLGKMCLDNPAEGNFIAGLDLLSFTDSVQRLKEKGFILVNEQNKILDFFEKKLASNVISTGFYGFSSAHDYEKFYNDIVNSDYGIVRMSVGQVISYMIGYGERNFWCYKSKVFEDWGDEQAWYSVQKKYATILVDLDKTCIDYSINGFNKEFIEKLQYASKKGMKFCFYYSNENFRNSTELSDALADKGINCLNVFCRKSFSQEIYIVNGNEDINKICIGL